MEGREQVPHEALRKGRLAKVVGDYSPNEYLRSLARFGACGAKGASLHHSNLGLAAQARMRPTLQK